MYRSLAVLPLQLACQFLVAENSSSSLNVSISLDSPVAKSVTDLPDGYAVFPDVGVAYKNYKTPLPWDKARKVCVSEGGYLAVIDSIEKVRIVMGLKENAVQPWVGFHRMFDITEWTEVKNGLPAVSIPWRTDTWDTDINRLCVALWLDGSGMYAIRCNEMHPFICEVPLFKE